MKLSYTAKPGKLIIKIDDIDSKFFGMEGKIFIKLGVKVHDSRPVHAKKTLEQKDFIIESVSHTLEIEATRQFYRYEGQKITIQPEIELKINDSLFFDTKISKKITEKLSKKPQILQKSPKLILNPKDTFNLLFNIKSINYGDRVKVLFFIFVGACIVIANTVIGIHDQLSPESLTYFYSHISSDGDSSSPFIKSLAGSGTLGFGVWVIIRSYLRRYMKFSFKKISWNLGNKEDSYKISDLLGGKSRIDLYNVTLKIVAGNIEKGQYTRGSGTKKRTVSFSHPSRAIVLFSKKYNHIPKNTDLSSYLLGDVSFGDMYRALYPKLKVKSSHGLDVHWEVQLIHDKLVDQELIGTQKICKYSHFLDA